MAFEKLEKLDKSFYELSSFVTRASKSDSVNEPFNISLNLLSLINFSYGTLTSL